MARAGQEGKQMPVGANQTYGQANGKPESNGKISYGDDLRNGKGGKK